MQRVLFFILGCISLGAHAQQPSDALRFSWTTQGGTARNQAIGGAMGSLGGDVSATFVNPAGLAFYKTGDLVITPQFQFGKTKASYLGGNDKDKTARFTAGTTGFVIGSGDNRGNVRNSALSIAINRVANFNSDVVYTGMNNQSSVSQMFVEELNASGRTDGGITSLFPNGSSLAFNTYWIDPVYDAAGNVTGFTTKSPIGTGLIQQQRIKNRGGITELALGLAVNLQDKFMIGGSIGVPFVGYKRDAEFLEADASDDRTNNFNYGSYREKYSTAGAGFNVKLGAIYKPAEFWRLGLALHSPTFMALTDVYEYEVETDAEFANEEVWTDYSRDYNRGEASQFKYTLTTPYKVIGSISYVLREIQDVTKQRGFLTADVEYVNHKASSYGVEDEANAHSDDIAYLKSVNKAIDKAYKGTFNFRVGGELKFTTIMVRLGAAYYGNPYKDIAGEKGHRLNLSGGLGYRNKGFFVDLTYVHATTKDVHVPYRLQTAPYSAATLKSGMGNALLTFGFKI